MLCSVDPPEAVVIDVGLAELFPPSQAESFQSVDAAGTLATMAPEVIRGRFAAKCDVWSLGCCLYALLCQRPRRLKDHAVKSDGDAKDKGSEEDDAEYYDYFYPFRPPHGESRPELKAYLERQKRGPDLARLRCSSQADDLVKRLLTLDHRCRPDMQHVLAHPWLQAARAPDQVLAAGQLDSLLEFHRTNSLVQAVLLDVASQLPLKRLRDLTSLFESLDKDGNGMLDRDELAEALQKAGLEPEAAQQAADMFTHDTGGTVEFSRFVAALVPSCRDLLQRELLRSSFDRLDADGDGFLTVEELQDLLERGSSSMEATQRQLLAAGAECCSSTSKSKPAVVVSASEEQPRSYRASSSRRLRAANAARQAFDSINGEEKVRVSFESFGMLLGGLLTER